MESGDIIWGQALYGVRPYMGSGLFPWNVILARVQEKFSSRWQGLTPYWQECRRSSLPDGKA